LPSRGKELWVKYVVLHQTTNQPLAGDLTVDENGSTHTISWAYDELDHVADNNLVAASHIERNAPGNFQSRADEILHASAV